MRSYPQSVRGNVVVTLIIQREDKIVLTRSQNPGKQFNHKFDLSTN